MKAADRALKIAGLVVATALGAALGLVTAFWTPLYFPGTAIRAPVALIIAIVGNPALSWFAFVVTGRRLAAVLPALVWCAVWLVAAGGTAEGDLVITGTNWVGLVTLLVGPIAFATGAIFSMTRRPKPKPAPPSDGDRQDGEIKIPEPQKATSPAAEPRTS